MSKLIKTTVCFVLLFSFCKWTFAQEAECGFSAGFDGYGYSFDFINNTGTGQPLSFNVSISETIFHDAYSFSTGPIPDGLLSHRDEDRVYPENVFGQDEVIITITTSDDPNTVIQECRFMHNRVAPTGAILVLDKSGSMTLQGKMQAAKTAAAAFIDAIGPLVYIPQLGLIRNNCYGVVLFNHAASVLNIYPAAPGLIDFEMPSEGINPFVVTSLQAVQPDGYTSIGGGLQVARNIIEGQAVDMRRVILLLSDGKENRQPWISSEVDPLVSDVIKVYSIGFGYDYQIDAEKLNNLSDATGGTYRHIEDPDHISKFFMEVLAEAFDMSVLVDPAGPISGGGKREHDVLVTSLDQELIFVLTWRDIEHDLGFKIRTASGEISPSNLPGATQYVDRGLAYKIYKVPVTGECGDIALRPGKWTAEVSAKGNETDYYNFFVLTKSAAKLSMNMPTEVFIGDDIPIQAKLVVNGEPVQNVNIDVTVSSPAENFNDRIARAKTDIAALSKVRTGDKQSTLKQRKAAMIYRGRPIARKKATLSLKNLKEKGKAVCGTSIKNVRYPGNYNLTFKAIWIKDKKETVVREWNRTVLVGAKPDLSTSEIKVKKLKRGIDKAVGFVLIDFAPKDMKGNYLGLGLQDEITLVGPTSKNKGFKDLANGWYRIETQVVKQGGPVFLRFRDNIWPIPLLAGKR